jgi:probable F420-dependent oxidoreductase
MKIGVTFPQYEIGNDPGLIREFAQTAEGLGYSHLVAYDHVLGAGIANRPDWRGPYTHEHTFHEIFVLFGYLAALTSRIELMTGVVILPQRQTILVAKQAAEVDVLSGGRLRLGVGIGWNDVEYEGLGMNFKNRGARSAEQIDVLRMLWKEPLVTFKGLWHTLTDTGINPLPIKRDIPIWIGGSVPATLERTVQQAEGWFTTLPPGDHAHNMVGHLRELAAAQGRSVKIMANVQAGRLPEAEWPRVFEFWQSLEIDELCVVTLNGKLREREHLTHIRRAAEVLGVKP